MSEAIIYKVVCNKTSNVYYGSTTNDIKTRMYYHKSQYKRYKQGKRKYKDTISVILELNDYSVSIVEKIQYNEYKEVLNREGFYIEKFDCVNKVKPARTRKQWREEHKQKQKEYMKDYMSKEENKQRKKKLDREYYNKIKDKLLEKVECECGSIVVRNGLTRHKKTSKHFKYINNKNIDV